MAGRKLLPVFLSMVVVSTGTEFHDNLQSVQNGIADLKMSLAIEKEILQGYKTTLQTLESILQETRHEKEEMKELYRTKRHLFFPAPGSKLSAQPVLGNVVHVEEIPVGPPGLPGPRGLMGTPGHPGQRGARGDKGKMGVPGNTGPPGSYGMPGVDGAPGEPGSRGPKGELGFTGYQGVRGDRGDAGLQGPNGQDGRIGFKGAQGHFGFMGPFGWPGRKGDRGLRGPKGEQGLQGIEGAIGVRGNPGSTGPKGYAGPRGAPGSPGIPGYKGQRGERGRPGENGPRGFPGMAYPAAYARVKTASFVSPAHPRYMHNPASGQGKSGPPVLLQAQNGAPPMKMVAAPRYPVYPAASVENYYKSIRAQHSRRSG